MSTYLYKFIVFSFQTGWAYSLIKDADWLSYELGGHGDFTKVFDNFPYQKHIPGLSRYL